MSHCATDFYLGVFTTISVTAGVSIIYKVIHTMQITYIRKI